MSEESLIDMPRLQALLPSYVNSTASASERLYVKNVLAQSAQARTALAWHEALAEKVINDVDAVPSDLGWAKLRAKARLTGHAQTLDKLNAAAGAENWRRRAIDLLAPCMPHRWLPAPALGSVCALLVAVVAGQGYLLVQSSSAESYGAARGSQPVGTAKEFPVFAQSKYIQLNFKDAVSERDMRLLLVRTGAAIVNGPGQLGDYTVAVPSNELDQALAQFKESLLTESARVVDLPSEVSTNKSGGTGAAPGQPKP